MHEICAVQRGEMVVATESRDKELDVVSKLRRLADAVAADNNRSDQRDVNGQEITSVSRKR